MAENETKRAEITRESVRDALSYLQDHISDGYEALSEHYKQTGQDWSMDDVAKYRADHHSPSGHTMYDAVLAEPDVGASIISSVTAGQGSYDYLMKGELGHNGDAIDTWLRSDMANNGAPHTYPPARVAIDADTVHEALSYLQEHADDGFDSISQHFRQTGHDWRPDDLYNYMAANNKKPADVDLKKGIQEADPLAGAKIVSDALYNPESFDRVRKLFDHPNSAAARWVQNDTEIRGADAGYSTENKIATANYKMGEKAFEKEFPEHSEHAVEQEEVASTPVRGSEFDYLTEDEADAGDLSI
jgi:hypothetical protein